MKSFLWRTGLQMFPFKLYVWTWQCTWVVLTAEWVVLVDCSSFAERVGGTSCIAVGRADHRRGSTGTDAGNAADKESCSSETDWEVRCPFQWVSDCKNIFKVFRRPKYGLVLLCKITWCQVSKRFGRRTTEVLWLKCCPFLENAVYGINHIGCINR